MYSLGKHLVAFILSLGCADMKEMEHPLSSRSQSVKRERHRAEDAIVWQVLQTKKVQMTEETEKERLASFDEDQSSRWAWKAGE